MYDNQLFSPVNYDKYMIYFNSVPFYEKIR